MSTYKALSLNWPTQWSTSAQSSGRGHAHPPILNTGGASYTNSYQVGTSEHSLSLGGVVHSAHGTSYSVPLPSLFGGRECSPIPTVWTYSPTVDVHTTQASSSRLPSSWPLCYQPSGASYLRPMSSALRSQPIYLEWTEWMGLNGAGRGFCSRFTRLNLLQFFCSLGDLFLDKVCFFGSSNFSSIWWIVIWCIALLLHCSASVLFGLFILPFPFHGYAINRGGVLVCRALSTLVLTLLLYPSLLRR
jgi:hypothetical protein